MEDHLVLSVDHLIKPESSQSLHSAEVPEVSGEGSCSRIANPSASTVDINDGEEHESDDGLEPLIPNFRWWSAAYARRSIA